MGVLPPGVVFGSRLTNHRSARSGLRWLGMRWPSFSASTLLHCDVGLLRKHVPPIILVRKHARRVLHGPTRGPRSKGEIIPLQVIGFNGVSETKGEIPQCHAFD